MEAGDIISLLLGLFAIAYVVLNVLADLSRKRNKQDEESVLDELVTTVKKPPVPPLPPPSMPKQQKSKPLRSMKGADEKFDFYSNLEGFRQKTAIEERALQIHLRKAEEIVSEDLRQTEGAVYKTKKKSPIALQIQALPSRSLLVISHELLRAPVAFRNSPFPRDPEQ